MQLQVSEVGRNVIIALQQPRLDHVVAAAFRDKVLEKAGATEQTLILDLSQVEFMDSSGLGALMGIRKRLGWSVRIVLAGLRSPVFRVFELAQVTSVFAFYTSVETALGRAAGDGDHWEGRAKADLPEQKQAS